MRRTFWFLLLLAVLAACGRPMSVEQAKGVAISVAKTGSMVPPRRMEDMTALLAAQTRSDSPRLAAWRAAADAPAPDGASPDALAEFFRSRGEAAWELGRSRQAREDFAAALARAKAASRGHDPRFLNILARSEENAGNLRGALDLLESCPAPSRNPGVYARMVRLNVKLGNLPGAQAVQGQGLALAARMDPQGKKEGVAQAVADMRASLAEGQGRWKEAEPHIRAILDFMSARGERPSEVFMIRLWLTRNLQAQGRLVDAEVEARQAVRDAAAASEADPGFLALPATSVTGVAGDGLLTMEDVLRLRLAADWVVLSACNTGAADGAGAEAVSGLGRAFFYAGARALLVSMWPVETFSARRLTTGLFAAQAREPALSRAEALRRSMLELMNDPGLAAEDGRQAVFAHPFFWAPFVLVGEAGGAAK